MNLVSSTQGFERGGDAKFRDPSPVVRSWLQPAHRDRFQFKTWEDLYRNVVKGAPGLNKLAEYLLYKSAGMQNAFNL